MSDRNFFFKCIEQNPRVSGNFLCKKQRYLTVYVAAEHEVMYLVCCDFTVVFKFRLNHFWTRSKFSALECHGYLAGKLFLEVRLVFC